MRCFFGPLSTLQTRPGSAHKAPPIAARSTDTSSISDVSKSVQTLPTIILVNATSLAKNGAIQLLQTEILSYDAEIAIVCETWFTTNHSSDLVGISGFTLIRKDRRGKKGGGVAIYVREDLCASQVILSSSASNELEILWIRFARNQLSFCVAAIYHPPRPRYTVAEFTNALTSDLDTLQTISSDDIIIIGGDFNALDFGFITSDLGLTLLNTGPTHGLNTLDLFFVNVPYIYGAHAHTPLLKTKHSLICVRDNNTSTIPNSTLPKKHVHRTPLYDLRPDNINRLRLQLSNMQWLVSAAAHRLELDEFYSCFIECFALAINDCIPNKSITMRNSDPPLFSPLIKSLLKRRCKLRLAGHIAEADIVNANISSLILKANSSIFEKVDQMSTKKLWAGIRKNANVCKNNFHNISPEVFNKFFINVSLNQSSPHNFTAPTSCNGQANLSQNSPANVSYGDSNINTILNDVCHPIVVERLLARVKSKSTDVDGIPMWAWRSCSYEIAEIVSYIFKTSILTGVLPSSWRCALVTPIPKVDNPVALHDYRPISVTPILSRLLEKIVVKTFLYPIIPIGPFCDQFAFRPLGSTTLALTNFFHKITSYLETNSYVRCLLIDFAKAFDVVNRELLLLKLVKLNVHPSICDWIAAFLSSRTQAVRVEGVISSFLEFNLGVIQGSGLGPFLFSVMISDLQPKSSDNSFTKFADDCSLLVPENSDTDIASELKNISDWAVLNHMTINFDKTKEIIFHRPRPRHPISPPPLIPIQRTTCAKLLGITLSSCLRFSSHVNNILTICSQRMYLLKSYKSKGLAPSYLNIVFNALILSRLVYGLSAWGGYLSVTETKRIDSLLKKCKKYGYTNNLVTLTSLLNNADHKLFNKIQNPNHPLFSLLPPKRNIDKNLRTLGHDFCLPTVQYEMHKCSFIIRSLFNFI